MGSTFRILAALLDAMVADWDWREWRVLGHVETAILRERPPAEREGWNLTHAERAMAQWGAVDQQGIYRAAGLSPTQTKVAEMHYSRQFTSREIGHFLGLSPIAVRVRLHEAQERLQRLGRLELAA
jgi:DNA-directed RNA polymerase specialized sigma24 family protein